MAAAPTSDAASPIASAGRVRASSAPTAAPMIMITTDPSLRNARPSEPPPSTPSATNAVSVVVRTVVVRSWAPSRRAVWVCAPKHSASGAVVISDALPEIGSTPTPISSATSASTPA